jgi:hypothetical protein
LYKECNKRRYKCEKHRYTKVITQKFLAKTLYGTQLIFEVILKLKEEDLFLTGSNAWMGSYREKTQRLYSVFELENIRWKRRNMSKKT